MTEKRNKLLFYFGSITSHFGSVIYSFAIGLYILNKTGSGSSFAMTLVFSILPIILLSPFAGVLADRFNKKRIVVSMDIANGVLFMGLFAVIQVSSINLWTIYITAFLSNLFVTFFGITITAAIPQLVDKKSLSKLNGTNQIIQSASGILAPILGGMAFALIDIKIFVLFNSITFFCSALSEKFIDFNYNRLKKGSTAQTNSITSVKSSLIDGYHYLMNNAVLKKLLALFIVFNFAFSFGVLVPLPYILNKHFSIGSVSYGLVNSFAPVGVITGALIIGSFLKKIQFKKLLLILTLLNGLLICLISLPNAITKLSQQTVVIIIFYATLRFLFGLLMSMVDVPIITIIQSETDEEYRGRVLSIIIALVKSSTPIAFLLSGFMLDRISPFIIPLFSGLISLISFAFIQKDVIKEIINSSHKQLEEVANDTSF